MIISNNCTSNSINGIYILSGNNNTINENVCMENGYYGIHMWYAENNELSDNLCNENGEGIYLQESNSNKMTDYECKFNSRYGIRLFESHYNEILRNNCNRNEMKGILIDCTRISEILNELGNQTGYWNKTTPDVMKRKMDENFVFKIHKNLL